LTEHEHDKLARGVFGNTTWTAALLRGFLEGEFLTLLDLKSIKLESGSFVDEKLKGHETDLVFSIQTREGPGCLFLLFEHQSSPIHLMPVRLMRYVVRILDRLWQEDSGLQSLPMVLPVVFYHGERAWKGPTRLSGLYQGSPRFKQVFGSLAAELAFKLIDLSKFSDAELKARVTRGAGMAMLTALLLKHQTSPDMIQELATWQDLIAQVAREPNALRALELFICYALKATTATEKELLRVVVPITQPEAATMIKTTGQRLREEGMAKGLAKGRAKGRVETLQKNIVRLLEVRFGQLSPEQAQVIKREDEPALEIMFERALQAENLQEVFGR